MQRRAFLTTGLSAAVLAPPTTAQSRIAAFKTAPGSFPVQVANTIVFRVEEQGKDLPLRVTTPVGAGPFPVVVFSHGAASSKDLYTRVIDHWASHGYAAIQPTHIDSESLGFRFGSATPAQVLSSRIGDMAFILDRLEAIAEKASVPGRLDATKIAAAGHSFGGWIALIMAGLPVIMPDGSSRTFGDTRIKALVSYNGVGPMDRVDNNGWKNVTVPVFASSGTNDPGATGDGILRPWRWRLGAYDFAGSQEKYAVSIALGDHYYGGLICREEAGGVPDPQGLAYTNGASTAFLDAYLKGDAAARRFLRTADLPSLTDNRAFLERR